LKKLIAVLMSIIGWYSSSAQCPTFIISTPQGTVVGCNPASVILTAANSSTLSNVTFTWVSATTGTATGATINGTAPTGSNTYTVLASSPASTCISTQQISLSSNTVAPTVTVSPLIGTLICNGPPVTFTAVSSPTTNVTGYWINPGGSLYNSPVASPVVLSAKSMGTYSVVFVNGSNGCATSNTVSVIGSTVIPTMSVSSSMGYTLSCLTVCLNMSITTTSSVAPISYTWTNVTTSTTATPANGAFLACTPGLYIATLKDGFGCTVSQSVSVLSTCTGIDDELNMEDNLVVYPNPTTGKIKISGIEKGEVMVLDVFGRIVKNVDIEDGEKELDLSTLPSGIYYLQMTQSSGSFKKKIIKQ